MTTRSLFSECARGRIAEILAEVYAPLLATLSAEKAEELLGAWRLYEAAIHDEPDTVGSAGFLTFLDDSIIGFGSWDPRGWPDVGHIGHNCIRPSYQRRGLGRLQVEVILGYLRRKGFRSACVRTDEHPFFTPARQMYVACGFQEVGREPGTLLDDCDTVVYELELSGDQTG